MSKPHSIGVDFGGAILNALDQHHLLVVMAFCAKQRGAN